MAAALAGEALQELVARERVQDIFFLDPRAEGGGDAEVDIVEVYASWI